MTKHSEAGGFKSWSMHLDPLAPSLEVPRQPHARRPNTPSNDNHGPTSREIIKKKMAAAPPREFKFVGGPSRKRRRNTGPPKSAATPAASAPATAPAATESAPTTSEPEQTTRGATPTYTADALHAVLSYLPNPTGNGLAEDRPEHGHQPGVEGTDGAGGVVTTGSMEGPGFFDDRLTTGIDWTYGNFMNPFIDAGLRFGDVFGAPPPDGSQVPFYFGPEMPFLYAGESPSIDSSTDSAAQADFHEEGPTRAGSVGSDITEAAGSPAIRVPDPHSIPSTMTDTVTRLLDLCTSPAPLPPPPPPPKQPTPSLLHTR